MTVTQMEVSNGWNQSALHSLHSPPFTLHIHTCTQIFLLTAWCLAIVFVVCRCQILLHHFCINRDVWHYSKKKLKGRDNSEDLGINGSILLKLIQNKQGMRTCTGFTWILIWPNSKVSWIQEWIFWVHKR